MAIGSEGATEATLGTGKMSMPRRWRNSPAVARTPGDPTAITARSRPAVTSAGASAYLRHHTSGRGSRSRARTRSDMRVGCGYARRRPTARRLTAVDGLVRDDAEQPRSEGRARAKAVECVIGLHEAFLRGLLGVGLVAGDDVCGARGQRLIARDELRVRVLIAVPCT